MQCLWKRLSSAVDVRRDRDAGQMAGIEVSAEIAGKFGLRRGCADLRPFDAAEIHTSARIYNNKGEWEFAGMIRRLRRVAIKDPILWTRTAMRKRWRSGVRPESANLDIDRNFHDFWRQCETPYPGGGT